MRIIILTDVPIVRWKPMFMSLLVMSHNAQRRTITAWVIIAVLFDTLWHMICLKLQLIFHTCLQLTSVNFKCTLWQKAASVNDQLLLNTIVIAHNECYRNLMLIGNTETSGTKRWKKIIAIHNNSRVSLLL